MQLCQQVDCGHFCPCRQLGWYGALLGRGAAGLSPRGRRAPRRRVRVDHPPRTPVCHGQLLEVRQGLTALAASLEQGCAAWLNALRCDGQGWVLLGRRCGIGGALPACCASAEEDQDQRGSGGICGRLWGLSNDLPEANDGGTAGTRPCDCGAWQGWCRHFGQGRC